MPILLRIVLLNAFNSDLANDYGNLLNRVSGLIAKNHDGRVPNPGIMTPAEEEIIAKAHQLSNDVRD